LVRPARTTNKEDFENKLLKMAFMACHAQKLVKYLRGKISQSINQQFVSRNLQQPSMFLLKINYYPEKWK
jgi:hypothetical protein